MTAPVPGKSGDDLIDEAIPDAAAILCAVQEFLSGTEMPDAAELAAVIRDADQSRIARLLLRKTDRELFALVITLAAMVPDDRPLPDLLGWLEPGTPQRDAMLLKAHNRASHRQAKGLPLWGPLAALENEYHQRWKELRAEAPGKAA